MKVLPMQQPWASLVVLGLKGTETRDRHTSHRGEIAVLATTTRVAFEDAPAAWMLLAEHLGLSAIHLAAGDHDDKLHRGKIVGTTHVDDSVMASSVRWDDHLTGASWSKGSGRVLVAPMQRAMGDFGPGRRVWLLFGSVAIDQPVICRGMPGIFEASDDVAREVAVQVRGARRAAAHLGAHHG